VVIFDLTRKFHKFFLKFLLAIFSIFIGLLLAEGIMRIDGRYSDIANTEIGGDLKIWSRSPNSIEYKNHPDLGKKISINFDEFGSRKSKFNPSPNKAIYGFFGDSFTENRRIENPYTFSELLNEKNPDKFFYNFGVDGYGIEQSYQRWIEVKDKIDINNVIYVFCSNDLRNTYEARIFDIELLKKGKLNNIVDVQIPWYIKFLSGSHLTYLYLEARFKAQILITKLSLSDKLGNKYSKAAKNHGERFHDSFADSILLDYLNTDPNAKTLNYANHYRNVLNHWSKSVEENGGKFHTFILPRDTDISLAKKLIPPNIKTHYIDTNSKYDLLQNHSWSFKNDGHWNEYGNLSAAISIDNYINGNNFAEQKFSDKLNKINNLYK